MPASASRSRSIAVTITILGLLLAPASGHAQGPAQGPAAALQVDLQAVGPTGVAGIALLGHATAGSFVQILVVGAPSGTTAIIHPGTCDSIGSALVALIGDVGTGGQAQATVPVALEVLTDGGHVIALHPGLDTATALGCGQIPAVVAPPGGDPQPPAGDPKPPAIEAPASTSPLPVPASPRPIEAPAPAATPQPIPTIDPACLGVADWIGATEARLTRINEALADLSAVAGRYDLPAYLSGLASLEGELQVMLVNQTQEPAPAAVAGANAQAITAFETYIDAARQIYDSMTVSVDVNSYSRAMARYEEARTLVGEVQRGIGQLKGTCAIT